MRQRFVVLMVFLSVIAFSTGAVASEKIIKFKDGSVVKGEVVSKIGDLYKIKASSLGFISVRDADIVSMEDSSLAQAVSVVKGQAPSSASAVMAGEKQAASGAPQASGDLKVYQNRIMSSPESMSAIQDLAKDKDVMDLINDPQLREAIFSGNVEYLKNNEKFIRFVNNPSVKKITQAALGPQKGAENGGQDQDQSGK
jgi:hypothetical protein